MNSIKKIAVIILMLAAMAGYGQKGPGREKIKSLKIAFITERLALTANEAQAFWPIYNAHEQTIAKLRRMERIEIRSKLRDLDLLSEEEAQKLLSVQKQVELDKFKADTDFLQQLETVLSAKKTIRLLRVEEEFKRRLLKQYRKKQ